MITGRSFGKINLFLKVKSKRSDGYHNISTLFSRISVFDLVTVEASKKFNIICSNKEIPTDENNIVFKVWNELKKIREISQNLKITIIKQIPAGAGLGGGSSNAATFLKLADSYLGLNLSFQEKFNIMSLVGSDTCFFLYDKPMIGLSRGEKLVEVSGLPQMKILIVKPDFSISTKDIYNSECLKLSPEFSLPPKESLTDFNTLIDLLQNDLEAPAVRLFPMIEQIKREMLNFGAVRSLMTGSGSAVFGIFPTASLIKGASAHFQKKYENYFVAESYNF